MADHDFQRWIDRFDARGEALDDARCVTLISNGSTKGARRTFRAEPADPELLEAGWSEDQCLARFSSVTGGAVVIEDNGWRGSAAGVITEASIGGRAGAVFWNLNMDNSLLLAENGVLLCSFEPFWLMDEPWQEVDMEGADPAVLGDLMHGLTFSEDYMAAAMTIVERFTGVRMDDRTWDPVAEDPDANPLFAVPHPTQAEFEAGLPDRPAVEPDPWEPPEPQRTPAERTWWPSPTGSAVEELVATRDVVQVRTVDGAVVRWSGRPDDPGTVVTGLPPVSALVAADEAFYALTTAGTVHGWGAAPFGSLGAGDRRRSGTPVPVIDIAGAIRIGAGSDTAAALLPTGQLRIWGLAVDGRLGDGVSHKYPAMAPQPVSGLPPMADFLITMDRVVARSVDGRVWEWGGKYWSHDDEGIGTELVRGPTRVRGLDRVVQLADRFAVTADGKVFTWYEDGLALVSVLSAETGRVQEHSSLVADVEDVPQPENDAGRWTFRGYLTQAKDEYVESLAPPPPRYLPAADNPNFQFYDGSLRAVRVPVPEPVLSVVAIQIRVLAITASGSIWAWGDGSSGQLGNGRFADSASPVEVVGFGGATQVVQAWQWCAALRSDGTVWVWGAGALFVRGTGDHGASAVPVEVPGLPAVTSIAVSGNGVLFAIAEGRVIPIPFY